MATKSIMAVGYREALKLARENNGIKFLNLHGKIVGLTDLRKITKGYFGRNLVKIFNEKIELSYIPIKRQKNLKRWDSYRNQYRSHAFDCEFAVGEDCTCWCGEVYHGWKGQNLDFKPQNYTINSEDCENK